MAEEKGGCLILLLIPVFFLAIAAAMMGLVALCTAGSVFGSGTAVYNYIQAFRRNVRVEEPAP